MGIQASGKDEEPIHDLFAQLGDLLKQAGSDLKHLVKGTYYVTDAQTSELFGKVRTNVYDPQRPPAASKATVAHLGIDGRHLALDMIAVVPPEP